MFSIINHVPLYDKLLHNNHNAIKSFTEHCNISYIVTVIHLLLDRGEMLHFI